jgi:hypothetical protein
VVVEARARNQRAAHTQRGKRNQKKPQRVEDRSQTTMLGRQEADGSFERWRPAPDKTPIAARTPLRFPVGTRVACAVKKHPGEKDPEQPKGFSWAPGTVVKHWFRERGWGPDEFAPYQVQLDAWDPAKVGGCLVTRTIPVAAWTILLSSLGWLAHTLYKENGVKTRFHFNPWTCQVK